MKELRVEQDRPGPCGSPVTISLFFIIIRAKLWRTW